MEVLTFKPKEQKDIPSALRNLAKEIETGKFNPTVIQWVVLDDEEGDIWVGGAGDLGNVYAMSGVFLAAATHITQYDEEDDG